MKRKTLVLVSVLLAALVLGMVPGGVLADEYKAPAIVRLSIAPASIGIGDLATVEVWVDSVDDFYGAQFKLQYNPAILDGVSVLPGPVAFPAGSSMVTQQTFAGNQVLFAASRVSVPPLPDNSNVLVATITFRGRSLGTSSFVWNELLLASDLGANIPYLSRTGSITVADTINVVGFAHMQGRTNHAGISVDFSGPIFGTTTTDGLGRYTGNVPTGTYQVLFEHDLYLATRLQNCIVGAGTVYHPPTVTLVAGDLIKDGQINIQDLTKCAGAFGSPDPTADVNADGVVNLFDLVLIGVNFGQTGPIVVICP